MIKLILQPIIRWIVNNRNRKLYICVEDIYGFIENSNNNNNNNNNIYNIATLGTVIIVVVEINDKENFSGGLATAVELKAST